ncbi:unnamed protein product, partial [Didymodactylos carnosus]
MATKQTFVDYGLKEKLLMGIYEKGWKSPLCLQEATIMPTLAGRDILVRAKNGSGKTGAYAIPILENIDITKDDPQALVIVTYERALYVGQTSQQLSKHLGIKIMITSGTRVEDYIKPVHVVIVAPSAALHDLMDK